MVSVNASNSPRFLRQLYLDSNQRVATVQLAFGNFDAEAATALYNIVI